MGKFKTQQEFIDAIVPGAQAGWKKYGVYASVTIGQALGEAGWQMTQPSAYKDNNLFGIKYPGNHAPGLTITQGTWATDDGGYYAHYESISDSVEDHGYFLRNNKRYPEAGAFEATNPYDQLKAIANAGYAGNPNYYEFISGLIKSNNLEQYDVDTPGGTGSTSSSSSEEEDEKSFLEKLIGKLFGADYDEVEVEENRSMSYFGSYAQQAEASNYNHIKDNLMNQHATIRHSDTPPAGYYNSISMPHREMSFQMSDEFSGIPKLADGSYNLSELAASGIAMSKLLEDGEDGSMEEYDSWEAKDVYEFGDLNRKFRVGDCCFVIPPESIGVTTRTSNDEIQGIRQSSSLQIKNGYSRKYIEVKLMLNGMNQINGYPAESPMGYKYYMDGLRALIAQFKYTPFVPIENTVVNLIHNVNNVALRGLNVSTVPGFPSTLEVHLTMEAFNSVPYTRMPDEFFDDSIDWDLFRWYIQQPLRDPDETKRNPEHFKRITTSELTSKFRFKLLTQEAIDKTTDRTDYYDNDNVGFDKNLYIDLTDDSDLAGNFVEIISDKDPVELTGISFGLSNIMPVIQLSDHPIPTMQYLGSSDTTFTFNFKTKDTSVAAKFTSLSDENQNLVRENKHKNGIGFLKVENELAELTGTRLMLLNDVTIATVPGFPGVYNISMECVSYDAAQKETERLVAFRPFPGDREGTRNDLINIEKDGLLNKIQQDCEAERKLQTLELYPDLHLPTYDEVDEALEKINAFRAKHNLDEKASYTKYPRHTTILPGSNEPQEYNGYVDPDFYFIPLISESEIPVTEAASSYVQGLYDSHMFGTIDKAIYNAEGSAVSKMIENFKTLDSPYGMFCQPRLQPDIVTEPEFAIGSETDSGIDSHGGLTTSDGKLFGSKNNSSVTQGGGANDATVIPTSIKKKTGNVFIDLLCDRADAKCGYIYGFSGQIAEESTYRQYGNNGMGTLERGFELWKGRQCFDCSGFVCWAANTVGLTPPGTRVAHNGFGPWCTSVSMNALKPGDLLIAHNHIAVYLGPDQTVEAANTEKGVIYGRIQGRNNPYTSAMRFKEMDVKNKEYLASNPGIYTDSSGGRTNQAIGEIDTASSNSSTVSHAIGYFSSTTGSGTNNSDLHNMLNETCVKYRIDPNFIKSVVQYSSGGDASMDKDGKVGLMGIDSSLYADEISKADLLDPKKNIEFGVKLYSQYGEKHSYDLTKMIMAVNSAGSQVDSEPVSVMYGSSGATMQTCIDSIKTLYSECLSNGGNSGTLNVPKDGGGTFTPSSSNSDTVVEERDKKRNIFSDADKMRNPNAGTKHGGLSDIDDNIMGKDFIEHIANARGRVYDFDIATVSENVMEANDPKHIIERMFVDTFKYDMKGLLTRAFPSYVFVVLDEQANWVGGEKLWTNYYVIRSAIDISIHQTYDSPISTAKATLSNFYNNLNQIKRSKTFKEVGFDDEGDAIRETLYNWTGTVLDEEISDKMIALKNKLYDDLMLVQGARIHIRLGYGSDPSKYPTVFNGCIAEIESGDVISLVAQSDGAELVSQPLTEKNGATNAKLGLGEEVSNIITEMLVKRESDFIYGLTSGWFKYKSKYGIEHFGLHYDTSSLGEAISAGVTTGVVGAATRTPLVGALAGVGTFIGTAATSNMSYLQYDIVKNIYNGSYKGKPFCKDPFNPFDGEYNFKFFCAGKTVWDAIKMCEKAVPDFVGYPRYFGFESRLFFGLPIWLNKYKYSDCEDGLYEYAKSFAQFHHIDSLDSIIENNLRIDTRNHGTNAIGIYTIGKDLASTPVVMSDCNIDWSLQKTKTYDTTSVQNFWFVPSAIDKVIEILGVKSSGKALAINVCISEVANSWKNIYQGPILTLGQPEISVYDYISINDTHLNMTGLAVVKEVVHSISVGEGLTSSIYPGLLANNTVKQSGLTNVVMGISQVGKLCAHVGVIAYARAKYVRAASREIKSAKLAYLASKGKAAKNFLTSIGSGLFTSIKKAKFITKAADVAKDIKSMQKVAGIFKATKTVFSAGATVGKVLLSSFPPALIFSVVADILLSVVLNWLHDMFAYRNTMILNPLMIQNPNGSVSPFIGGVKGQKTLLPKGVYGKSDMDNIQ